MKNIIPFFRKMERIIFAPSIGEKNWQILSQGKIFLGKFGSYTKKNSKNEPKKKGDFQPGGWRHRPFLFSLFFSSEMVLWPHRGIQSPAGK